MIAIKRLQSIMWILLVMVGALSAYLVSLRVATERNAVLSLERQIYTTRANIRYLEVEFSARSTMRQLASWNAQDIKYAVPGADRYLASEQQLAEMDALGTDQGPVYAAPPVMAAMAQADAAPAMVVPVKAEGPKPVKDEPALAVVRPAAVPAEPARARVIPAVAMAKAESAPRVVKLVEKADPAQAKRATRLALLEQTLLGSKPLIRAERAEGGKAAH